jgi:hypothetical protein
MATPISTATAITTSISATIATTIAATTPVIETSYCTGPLPGGKEPLRVTKHSHNAFLAKLDALPRFV